MKNSADHIFMYIFDICVFSLVRSLFKSSAHFLTALFVFILLSFKYSIHFGCQTFMSCIFLSYYLHVFSWSYSLDNDYQGAEAFSFKNIYFERERKSALPSAGSFLKWPQGPELGQYKARRQELLLDLPHRGPAGF